MRRYRVVMRNPKTGSMESYVSDPTTLRELISAVEVFRMAGYTEIDFREVGGDDCD